jgi:hypothetical protein
MFSEDDDSGGKKKKKKTTAKTTPPNGSGGGFLSRVLGFGSSASTTMAQDFDADQAEDNEGEKTDDRLSLSIYDRTATGRQRGGGRTELPAMTSPPRPKLRLGFGGSSEEDDGEEAALAALSKEHTKKKKGKKRKKKKKKKKKIPRRPPEETSTEAVVDFDPED